MTGNLWRMMMCIGRSKAPTRLQCRIATVGKASNQTSLPIISNHPWTQCSCQWQKLRWNHQDWHICTWITWTSQSPLFLGLLFTSIDNYFHFWSIYNQWWVGCHFSKYAILYHCIYYPMSLFIVGSVSRITSNIVHQIAKTSLYRSVTIADLLPTYDFHHRFYRLQK